MKNQGGLAQLYASIILGYVTEAVIQYDALRKSEEAKPNQKSKIIVSGSLQSVVNKIESAFGDLEINHDLSLEENEPVISWDEIVKRVKEYLNMKEHIFNGQVFQTVFKDILNMGILCTQNLIQPNIKNPLYRINTKFFTSTEIAKQTITFEQAINTKMQRYLHDETSQLILTTLAQSAVASLNEEELSFIREENKSWLFMQRYGIGTLLGKLRIKGVKYGPYIKTINSLMADRILIQGCYKVNNEFITINPILKPFSVIVEVVTAISEGREETQILEAEIASDTITPFETMINLSRIAATSQEVYIFEGYNFDWDPE